MSEVVVNNVRYKNKKELENACRFIISQTKDYELLSGSHERFVAELFKRHPEHDQKSGCGIAGFSVEPDARWGTTRHFVVVRTDGTTIDFSWKICVAGKLPDKRVHVLDAMREAIWEQVVRFRVETFRSSPTIVCPLTGETVNSSQSDVDHCPPDTFLELVNQWLAEHDLSFDSVVIKPCRDGYGWEMAAPEQRVSWTELHQERAHLRMVSRNANH